MTIEERFKKLMEYLSPYPEAKKPQSPWFKVEPTPTPGPEEFGANADYVAGAMKESKKKK